MKKMFLKLGEKDRRIFTQLQPGGSGQNTLPEAEIGDFGTLVNFLPKQPWRVLPAT
jgi:hypothetical protein